MSRAGVRRHRRALRRRSRGERRRLDHRTGLIQAQEPSCPSRTIPTTGSGTDGPVEPGPAVVFDMDGVLSDAAGRQHYLERPYRDWEAFFAGLRRRPAHRRGGAPARGPRPRPADRPADRPTDPGAAPDARLARALPAALGPAHHARLRRLRRVAGLQAAHGVASCGRSGSTCAWPSRTTVATTTCSTPRASPASTSTPATTSDGPRGQPGRARSVGPVAAIDHVASMRRAGADDRMHSGCAVDGTSQRPAVATAGSTPCVPAGNREQPRIGPLDLVASGVGARCARACPDADLARPAPVGDGRRRWAVRRRSSIELAIDRCGDAGRRRSRGAADIDAGRGGDRWPTPYARTSGPFPHAARWPRSSRHEPPGRRPRRHVGPPRGRGRRASGSRGDPSRRPAVDRSGDPVGDLAELLRRRCLRRQLRSACSTMMAGDPSAAPRPRPRAEASAARRATNHLWPAACRPLRRRGRRRSPSAGESPRSRT